jgi:hypothetical protein
LVALLGVIAGVGEVEGAGGVEGLAGVTGEAAVQQDGVGVAAGAGLPDRKRPLVVVTEVLDAAELDRVVVVVAEVAGQVAGSRAR